MPDDIEHIYEQHKFGGCADKIAELESRLATKGVTDGEDWIDKAAEAIQDHAIKSMQLAKRGLLQSAEAEAKDIAAIIRAHAASFAALAATKETK